ncbi:hypothetical protein HPB47_024071, partial [Ixodes persulcatus]
MSSSLTSGYVTRSGTSAPQNSATWAESQQGKRHSRETPTRGVDNYLVLGRILLLLLLIVVCMVPVLLFVHGLATAGDRVCNSTDCHLVAAALNSSIYGTTHPCDDFYQFVCGSFLGPTKDVLSLLQLRMNTRFRAYLDLVPVHPYNKQTAIEKAVERWVSTITNHTASMYGGGDRVLADEAALSFISYLLTELDPHQLQLLLAWSLLRRLVTYADGRTRCLVLPLELFVAGVADRSGWSTLRALVVTSSPSSGGAPDEKAYVLRVFKTLTGGALVKVVCLSQCRFGSSTHVPRSTRISSSSSRFTSWAQVLTGLGTTTLLPSSELPRELSLRLNLVVLLLVPHYPTNKPKLPAGFKTWVSSSSGTLGPVPRAFLFDGTSQHTFSDAFSPDEWSILTGVQVTPEEARELELNSRQQARSTCWQEARSNRLTASRFGQVDARDEWTQKGLENLIEPKDLSRVRAVQYGRNNEGAACDRYGSVMKSWGHNVSLQHCGLVVHPSCPWLGASPDRLVYDPEELTYGVLEVKCPYSLRDSEPDF